MKERGRSFLEGISDRIHSINEAANVVAGGDAFIGPLNRMNPEYVFSSSGGLEYLPDKPMRFVNLGMGIWLLMLNHYLVESAKYIADLTGGRHPDVAKEDIGESIEYYREVINEAFATLQGKPPLVIGLN